MADYGTGYSPVNEDASTLEAEAFTAAPLTTVNWGAATHYKYW